MSIANEWKNKMCVIESLCVLVYMHTYTHAVGYYSALKRTGILTHSTIWLNLEDSVASEINSPHL